ncbi:MAG: AAA family ATPase, partial [Thermoprotei archaeon]
LNQRGSAVVGILPSLEDPYVRAMEVIERPKVRYGDVGGLKEQIRELREVVELPLKNPDLFREMGIEPPKGVLLYGPPGCGKTLLAKAVAGESNATFISLVASELAQKFVGEGARIVREVFSFARKKAPAIVLIDELDAIGAKRLDVGTSGEREIHRTLTQLLAELDGFEPLDNVKVLATTNRIDILDPALLRPGRFDRLIEVPLPDLQGRLEIFKIHTRNMRIRDVDLESLARLTEGASGADIRAICTEAGFTALRNNRSYITMDDFIEAAKKILKERFRPYAESSNRTQERKTPSVV